MPDTKDIQALAPALRWRPGPIFDPVPDWLISQLDRAAALKLAAIQMELGKNILQAQLNATAAAQEVLRAVK